MVPAKLVFTNADRDEDNQEDAEGLCEWPLLEQICRPYKIRAFSESLVQAWSILVDKSCSFANFGKCSVAFGVRLFYEEIRLVGVIPTLDSVFCRNRCL